jgi:hypothetical protein
MAKKKKTILPDLSAEDMMLAEEDLAAMRPALAVAPELVVQTLSRKRKRRPQKRAKTRTRAKTSAKKGRKSSRKQARRRK